MSHDHAPIPEDKKPPMHPDIKEAIIERDKKYGGYGSSEWVFSTRCVNHRSLILTLFMTPEFLPYLGLGMGIPLPVALKEEKYEAKRFLNGDYDNQKQSIAAQLMSKSENLEHIIFNLAAAYTHTLSIEKIGNGVNTYWRIYQASIGEFSGSQWISSEPLPKEASDHYRNTHRLYGQGKLLNQDQIKAFLMEEVRNIFSDNFIISQYEPVGSLNPYSEISKEPMKKHSGKIRFGDISPEDDSSRHEVQPNNDISANPMKKHSGKIRFFGDTDQEDDSSRNEVRPNIVRRP